MPAAYLAFHWLGLALEPRYFAEWYGGHIDCFNCRTPEQLEADALHLSLQGCPWKEWEHVRVTMPEIWKRIGGN